MPYDSKRKKVFIDNIKEKKDILSFLGTFVGQSEIVSEIVLEMSGSNPDWKDANRAQYLFNQYFYHMK